MFWRVEHFGHPAYNITILTTLFRLLCGSCIVQLISFELRKQKGLGLVLILILCYSGIELPSGFGYSPLLFRDGDLRLVTVWYIFLCTCLVCSVCVLHFHSCSFCCKWYTHAKGAQIFQKYGICLEF